ncbi:MAG: gamma-glutamylcyclotransferase family protein [Propionicimonas sp.]|uniref:gamma-glutamylcyclotransferase family protein n=1 Tax=Propionicimonas sp. TaxID=1955623 RepID=UPI003D115F09
MTEWVFSYGTLRLADVQRGTYGRLLDGEDDQLVGWTLQYLAISNPEVVALSGIAEHPVAVPTGDPSHAVAGTRFSLTATELAATDVYESADYVRVPVVLASGVAAWLYVAK